MVSCGCFGVESLACLLNLFLVIPLPFLWYLSQAYLGLGIGTLTRSVFFFFFGAQAVRLLKKKIRYYDETVPVIQTVHRNKCCTGSILSSAAPGSSRENNRERCQHDYYLMNFRERVSRVLFNVNLLVLFFPFPPRLDLLEGHYHDPRVYNRFRAFWGFDSSG